MDEREVDIGFGADCRKGVKEEEELLFEVDDTEPGARDIEKELVRLLEREDDDVEEKEEEEEEEVEVEEVGVTLSPARSLMRTFRSSVIAEIVFFFKIMNGFSTMNS